jgi:alpha-tubulin suppressor-like RCC1 family protein
MRYPASSTRTRTVGLSLLLAAVVGCGEENPSSPSEPDAAVATAAAPLTFRQISAGTHHACGTTTDDRVYCWGGIGGYVTTPSNAPRSRPTAMATSLRFVDVRAGLSFTCGLATDDKIYCWGTNVSGQLGNSAAGQFSGTPVAVAGSRRWKLVRVGAEHACGITGGGVTFCWGLNASGQLGDGTRTTRRNPVRVQGGLTFQRLSVGWTHNCAVTAEKKAYCWGENASGQLGDRTSTDRLKPVAVYGGLAFDVVGAGGAHTCGVTTAKAGYCWGANQQGQLGDGTFDRHGRPLPVAGGLAFSGISAGTSHSCGVTTAKRAYCWGWNWYGQLGEGTNATSSPFILRRSSPVAVLGGLSFDAVLGGDAFTCGVTTAGQGYCWGQGSPGKLGDGTESDRAVPTAVATPN